MDHNIYLRVEPLLVPHVEWDKSNHPIIKEPFRLSHYVDTFEVQNWDLNFGTYLNMNIYIYISINIIIN